MTEKTRRKQFLNDFCEAFGIGRADSRRSQAGNIYIEFGEERCRAWLTRSNHKFRTWNSLVNRAKWEKVVKGDADSKSASLTRAIGPTQARSKKRTSRLKSKIRKNRQPHVARISEEEERQANLSRHKAMVMRGQSKARKRAEKDRNRDRTKKDSGGKPRVGEGRRRRAHERALRTASMSAKNRYKDFTPTAAPKDARIELAKVREQLQDELSRCHAARRYILASLRARISELSAEADSPTI